MSFLALATGPAARAARRAFLGKSGLLLSGTAVALLAGQEALAVSAYLGAVPVPAAFMA